MLFQLDEYDVSILQALIMNGRKSIREIPRETGITTPTVKSRFEQLVNVGFIKSVSPILDFGIVDEDIVKPEPENRNGRHKKIENERETQYSIHQMQRQLKDARSRIKKGLRINLDCEF